MNNSNVDKIKYFIEQNIVFKNKPNYIELQNNIISILDEVKNNQKEYNKLLDIFIQEFGWNKEILDALLSNDIEKFKKIRGKLNTNIIKDINDIETTIREFILKNDSIPNIEKLFPMVELKDKQLMEFKSLLNGYILHQFELDIKSGVYNNVLEEDILNKIIEQVNKHTVIYQKLSEKDYEKLSGKDKELIIKEEIKEDWKGKKVYNILSNNPRIDFINGEIKLNMNTSGQIDTLLLLTNKNNKEFLYGEDVTADFTGRIDRNMNYKVKEDTLLTHEESLNKMSKIFKIDYIYNFDINILFNINEDMKKKSLYNLSRISNKEKYSSKTIVAFLKLISKNFHLNEEGLSDENMNENRNTVGMNIYSVKNKKTKYNQLKLISDMNIENKEFVEGIKLFSLINNKEQLKELLNHLYNKDNQKQKQDNKNQSNISNKNKDSELSFLIEKSLIKEINKDELKSLLEKIGKLIKLYHNQYDLLIKEKEVNERIINDFYNVLIYITHSDIYTMYSKLEVLNKLNNHNHFMSQNFFNHINNKLFFNRLNAFEFSTKILSGKIDAEEKANQAEKKANQAEEKANQSEEKANQAEEKANQAEEKANQAEEKANQSEEKEKNTFKNIKLKGFKDNEIIDMINLNKENIIKYIKEGIITDKEIINQYSEELNNLKNASESIESKILNNKGNVSEHKQERRKNSKKRTEMENLIIENYCISRMNINNKNEEMIKKYFFELIEKEPLLKDKDFNKQYENIKKEGEFYLKIIHLYELDLKKRKKELKSELVGSQYYDKIKTKVDELEKQSDFLIKHKRIEKEDKDKFITFLLNEFKQIENKHFEESELLLIADKYIKWKINQNQTLNKENKFENKGKNKSVLNNKTINNNSLVWE